MPCSINLHVAARASPLSQAQVEEVLCAIQVFYPIQFTTTWLTTSGDVDQTTSLRSLDKTDFFTKEIDQFLLQGKCDIAIHSAKDLPHPMPPGLEVMALTKGLDPSDSLVLRPGEQIETLPQPPCIATSSERREELVRKIIPQCRFRDVRGTIHKRLSLLTQKEADGVVLAEAALIRLKLTHLNRLLLPGVTVPYQGQLAVVGKKERTDVKQLFFCIDSR